jgi:uncharacterized membrane protein YqjE
MMDRARRLGASLFALAGIRLRLFGLELREEVRHAASMIGFAAAAAILLSFALGFLGVLAAVAFWDSNRLAMLAVVTAVYLVGGLVCLRLALNALRAVSRPFEASAEELERDRAALLPEERP